jgi:hypothetical protein
MTALTPNTTQFGRAQRTRLAVAGQAPQLECWTQHPAEFIFPIPGFIFAEAWGENQRNAMRECVAGLNERGSREGEAAKSIHVN